MKALDSIRNDLFKSFKFHVFAMSDRCIWKFAYRGDKCCFVTVVLLYPQCLAYTDFKYGANKEWRVNFWVRSCTFLPLWSTQSVFVWQNKWLLFTCALFGFNLFSLSWTAFGVTRTSAKVILFDLSPIWISVFSQKSYSEHLLFLLQKQPYMPITPSKGAYTYIGLCLWFNDCTYFQKYFGFALFFLV